MAEAVTIQEQPRPPRLRLGRTVIALGVVSLFTDMSSEMAYTQVPIYLTGVLGASAVSVGLIEGVAESTASLLRLVSGYWSDKSGKRKPLTVLGYSFGAISKPLMALATVWPLVLLLRFVDRFGKGLRTAPRDALITETTPKSLRGRAFGLHRAMDTTGAVLGPLLGLAFLGYLHRYAHSYDLGHNLRLLFVFAGLPGLLAVLTLVFAVKEEKGGADKETGRQGEKETGGNNAERGMLIDESNSGSAVRTQDSSLQAPSTRASIRASTRGAGRTWEGHNPQPSAIAPLNFWNRLQPEYRRFLLVILLFNLGNSSDAFLVLRARNLGFTPSQILWLYAAFNVVEAVLGYGAGILSDRIGRRPLIIAGYGVFALVYLGFGLASSKPAIVILFLLYGLYYTLTQGVQRAFASDMADPAQRATQIGAYHTIVGLALLPASLLAGFLFDLNPAFPFFVGTITACLSALLLGAQKR